MTYNKQINDLKKELEFCDFRFSNYQDIPSFVIKKIPELKQIKYIKNQIDLDLKRYKWLKENLPKKIKKVCEIGANMGYFSILLAKEFQVSVEAYESNRSYTNVCSILAKLVNLDKKLKFHNKSVNLNNINSLENYDLMINLNVLHHAGVFFDRKHINNKKDWMNYSISYLKKLGEKSNFDYSLSF